MLYTIDTLQIKKHKQVVSKRNGKKKYHAKDNEKSWSSYANMKQNKTLNKNCYQRQRMIFHMIKTSINQEDITIIIIYYASSSRDPKYLNKKLTELNKQSNNSWKYQYYHFQ